jgi:chitinase
MTHAWKPCLVALLLTFVLSPSLHAVNPRLLGYYEYSDRFGSPAYDASTIPYDQVTHIVHSNIAPAAAGDGTLAVPNGFLEPALIANAHAAGVKVELCVSGNPNLFVTIDNNPALRAAFARNIAAFAIANGYDGVDFDYEVPTNNEQAVNFTGLVKNLRDSMPAGQYLISAAVSSSPGDWGVYDFAGMTPLVDFYNVMTYDFHGPWTNHSGHNSPLYLSPIDPGQEGSLDTSAEQFLTTFAVPAEKINLGTAFYGYAFNVENLWTLCPEDALCGNFGVPSLNYTKAAQLVATGDYVEYFDEQASAPYLLDARGEGFGFITYDNPQSTFTKVTYALGQRHLGGVFMWELSLDFDGHSQPLLNSMHEAMVKATVRARH